MWLAPSNASFANICMTYYNRAGNTISLLNDAGTAWTTMTAGTAGTLQNSQCSLNVATTAATASGNTLTMSLPLTFNPAFAGAQQVWMSAVGGAGSSGWQQRGNWTVTAPVESVQAVSVTPVSGSGSS